MLYLLFLCVASLVVSLTAAAATVQHGLLLQQKFLTLDWAKVRAFAYHSSYFTIKLHLFCNIYTCACIFRP